MALSRSKIRSIAQQVLEDTDLTEEEAAEAAEKLADKYLQADVDAYEDDDGAPDPRGDFGSEDDE